MSTSAAPSSTAYGRPPAPVVGIGVKLGIALVVTLIIALMFITGSPLTASAPLTWVVLLYLIAALPLRWHLFALIFAGSVADASSIELPSGGIWYPPLYGLRVLLFENLNKVVPIEALRFSFVDLFYVSLLLIAAIRAGMKIRVDTRHRQSSTLALDALLVVSLVTVALLEVYGIGFRGGDFKQSLWQFRQIIWLPIVIWLFSYAMRDARDFQIGVNVMIVAACIKIVPAVKFFFGVARPLQFEPATLTSHYDSILFVVAFMALVIRLLHNVNLKNWMMLLGVGGWIMLGIVLNNRRLAFVGLGVGLALAIIILRGPVKASLKKFFIIASPLIFVYCTVGQNKTQTIFKPARQIMSVFKQDDRSSGTRDIENFNLIWTLKPHKVLGAGWGHEYVELVRADDISQHFAQYRFIAHNSILWLWTVGGLVGFTVIWMQIVIGIFFARRAYLFARSSLERDTASMALVMLAVYMMQAWGDMGVMGLNSTLTAGIAIAIAAKLAVTTGAFPARLPLLSINHSTPPVQTTVRWPVVS